MCYCKSLIVLGKGICSSGSDFGHFPSKLHPLQCNFIPYFMVNILLYDSFEIICILYFVVSDSPALSG